MLKSFRETQLVIGVESETELPLWYQFRYGLSLLELGTGLSFLLIFAKLVFAITSRIRRILTEHIDSICSLESKLSFVSIYSVRIFYNLENIEIDKNRKMLNRD